MVKRSITLGAGGGRVTLTVVDADRDPPSPTASIVYGVVLPGQTCRNPLGSTFPTPWSIEAVAAFAEDHTRVAHWPCWISVGLAERDTVGAGGAVTVTVVEADRDPPSPTAAIVYCVVLPGQTCRNPLGSTLPRPWLIEALAAFAEVHASVAHWPRWIVAGLAERDTIGAGGAVTLTVVDADWDPPSPTAAIVNCVVLPGQTCRNPLRSTFPTPWSIEALAAFAEVHIRVAH
jgi:hypothetical protein